MEDDFSHYHINQCWKARIWVCGLMLGLAFAALLLMDLQSRGYWFFALGLSVSYAVMSLWLFWYLHRKQHVMTGSTIWHQLFHWLGLMATIWMVSQFVNAGIIGSLPAGVITVTLLALTVYLIGVYSDITFVLIGVVLAIFAWVLGYLQAYLIIIMIPVVLIAALLIFVVVHRQKHKAIKGE